ncbi:hypothetical protein CDQ83_00060 [Clostridium thermosuccinogenes]|nr:hypothetical protein CDQ83_00060 [Pseudoclostridium thermosuccinogenes]
MKNAKQVEEILKNEIRLLPLKTLCKDSIHYLCVFPDFYEYGLPNIGMQTIYRECYNHKNVVPDRYYMPKEEWKDKELTWEQKVPASSCDIIGFSISYEGSYLNVLKCLRYMNIPLKQINRKERYPLVIGGGVVTMYNPLPLSPFFDVAVRPL